MRRHATMVMALIIPMGLAAMTALSATALAQGAKKPAAAASKPAAGDAGAGEKPAEATQADGGAPSSNPTDTAAGPSANATASAAPPAGADGASYTVRLRDLQTKVDDLKEQIRRSHTRLSLLSETIMTGGASGSRAEVVFENKMTSAFRLVRALFVIDGNIQFNRADESGALGEQAEIPIFNGSVPPGDHTVQVLLNFQGNGYGVFTYLKGYKFEVKSSHSFTSVEGKAMTLTAVALEKGGPTTPLEQRPAIEWREKIQALSAASAAASAPAAKGVSASVSAGGKP